MRFSEAQWRHAAWVGAYSPATVLYPPRSYASEDGEDGSSTGLSAESRTPFDSQPPPSSSERDAAPGSDEDGRVSAQKPSEAREAAEEASE